MERKETNKNKGNKYSELSSEDIYRRAVSIMESECPFIVPKFDIRALALKIPTNRVYLSAAINKIAGVNFCSWLAKYRIEYAKTILRSNPTIKSNELAYMCGFDNRVSLYRQFKKIEGVTPLEWLRNNNYR